MFEVTCGVHGYSCNMSLWAMAKCDFMTCRLAFGGRWTGVGSAVLAVMVFPAWRGFPASHGPFTPYMPHGKSSAA